MFDFNALSSADVLQPVFALVLIGAVVYAFTAKSPTRRAIAWGVVYASWFATLCTTGDTAVSGIIAAVLFLAPPVLFILASWRLPRGRRDTITAEIGLLVLIVFEQAMVTFSNTYDFTGETAPDGILALFLVLAAVFVAAAIPVPTRRIAYGAAALSCVLLGVFREVLLWSKTGQHPDVPFNDDLLVAAVYVGIPAIGTVAQIVWTNRRASSRTE